MPRCPSLDPSESSFQTNIDSEIRQNSRTVNARDGSPEMTISSGLGLLNSLCLSLPPPLFPVCVKISRPYS